MSLSVLVMEPGSHEVRRSALTEWWSRPMCRGWAVDQRDRGTGEQGDGGRGHGDGLAK